MDAIYSTHEGNIFEAADPYGAFSTCIVMDDQETASVAIKRLRSPQLLRTCKAMFADAQSLYMREHLFYDFTDDYQENAVVKLDTWIARQNNDLLAAIRKVKLAVRYKSHGSLIKQYDAPISRRMELDLVDVGVESIIERYGSGNSI
jgi:hypothetical protein